MKGDRVDGELALALEESIVVDVAVGGRQEVDDVGDVDASADALELRDALGVDLNVAVPVSCTVAVAAVAVAAGNVAAAVPSANCGAAWSDAYPVVPLAVGNFRSSPALTCGCSAAYGDRAATRLPSGDAIRAATELAIGSSSPWGRTSAARSLMAWRSSAGRPN